MTRRHSRPAMLATTLLMLAACTTDGTPGSAWSLEGRPGLLRAIERYYQSVALENMGRCQHVLMDGVTRSEVVVDEPERMVLDVRYRYRSTSPSERRRGCGGFGERTFEIAIRGDDHEVVSMSGDQHDPSRLFR